MSTATMISSDKELTARVDEDDNILGLKERENFYTGQYIHRSVGLLLVNDRGEILVCLRNKKKKQSAGVYSHSVNGGVSNETYDESIERELFEELGIKGKIIPLYKYFFEQPGKNKMWKKIYLCRSTDPIVPDRNEIVNMRRLTRKELKEDLSAHSSHYSKSFVKSMDILGKMIMEGEVSL